MKALLYEKVKQLSKLKLKKDSVNKAAMQNPRSIGGRIKEFREVILGGKQARPTKWVQSVFGKICRTSTGAVSNWERGGPIHDKHIDALVDAFAPYTGLTREWLKFARGTKPYPPITPIHFFGGKIQVLRVDLQEPDMHDDPSISGPYHNFVRISSGGGKVAPIFAAYETPLGNFIMHRTKPIGRIDVPQNLSDVFDSVYAFKMPSAEMEPMFSIGQTLIVNPTNPLEPNKGVVIFKADRSEFLVRRFLRSNQVEWVVRKYIDEKPFEERLLREEWPIAEFIFAAQWG